MHLSPHVAPDLLSAPAAPLKDTVFAAVQTVDATKEHSQQAFTQASSNAAVALCCNACTGAAS